MPWLSSRAARAQRAAQPPRVLVHLLGADVLDHADRGDGVERLARRARGSRRRGSRCGRRRPASSARRRAVSTCGGESVMPVTWTPWRWAAWIANEPQPQPTSSTRWPRLSAELLAHELELGLLRLLERRRRRARRSRTSRSSSGRGRGGRTRAGRRSGGGRRASRARSSGSAPSAGARTDGGPGGRTTPVARSAASASLALVRRSIGGRLPGVDDLDDGVEVVDVDRAGDVGAAEAELAGRAQHVRERLRRAGGEGGPAVGLRGRDLGAVPEDDAERPLGERILERRAERGGTGHAFDASGSGFAEEASRVVPAPQRGRRRVTCRPPSQRSKPISSTRSACARPAPPRRRR